MVDFILMGLLEVQGTKTRELQNEKILPTAGLKLTIPVSKNYHRNRQAIRSDAVSTI